MFKKFFNFVKVKDTANPQTAEDFLQAYSGTTFLNGLYRIFNLIDSEKYKDIVYKSFPKFKNKIQLFGFDWLGNILGIDVERNAVLVFEPGTGEQFNTKANFVDFHNKLIPEYPQDCLAINFFNDWFKANDNYLLKYNQCAGYKVPLFLNGEDTLENLEASDMEVYWEIMMPLMNL